MCNAWNHPPGCTCGWGGEGYSGGGGLGVFSNTGHERNAVVSYRYETVDFCHPTRCPHCRASVFFIRHNGGSVWVDNLGWPWPKHGCFDDEASERAYISLASLVARYAGAIVKPVLGHVIKCVHGFSKKHRIYLINMSNGRVAVFAGPELGKVLHGLLTISHVKDAAFFLEDAKGATTGTNNLNCGTDQMRAYLRKPAIS